MRALERAGLVELANEPEHEEEAEEIENLNEEVVTKE
jgi:hypothetical protein